MVSTQSFKFALQNLYLKIQFKGLLVCAGRKSDLAYFGNVHSLIIRVQVGKFGPISPSFIVIPVRVFSFSSVR